MMTWNVLVVGYYEIHVQLQLNEPHFYIKIRFENDANATAPAQRVFITHDLDPDLDWRTFRLGSFGFGNVTETLDYRRAIYQNSMDLLEERGYVLNVQHGVDIVNGRATWLLQTIDPETGGCSCYMKAAASSFHASKHIQIRRSTC